MSRLVCSSAACLPLELRLCFEPCVQCAGQFLGLKTRFYIMVQISLVGVLQHWCWVPLDVCAEVSPELSPATARLSSPPGCRMLKQWKFNVCSRLDWGQHGRCGSFQQLG